MADLNNITQVQVGGLVRFIRIRYANMGAEMIQRQRHHQSSHGWHVTWCGRQLTKWGNLELLAQTAGRSVDWSVSQPAQIAEPLLGS